MNTSSYKALELAFKNYSSIEFDLMNNCPSTSEYFGTIKNFECKGHWLFITCDLGESLKDDDEGLMICPDLMLLVDDNEHMIWAYCLDEAKSNCFKYLY